MRDPVFQLYPGSEIAAHEGWLQFTVNAEIGPNLTH